MSDKKILRELENLVDGTTPDNLGDRLIRATKLLEGIQNPMARQYAEISMSNLRRMAVPAEYGWKLFASLPHPTKQLPDIEAIQLIAIISALHELSYACESVNLSATIGWGGSAQTRFYLNSIYHYVSSMFLLDTSSPRQENLPMGGTVIRALYPIGISDFLIPINRILSKPFGKTFSFGEAMLKLRHSYLVHGDFSPRRVEYLVTQTEMRNPVQQERLASLIWELFHEIIILRLKLIAFLTQANLDLHGTMIRYLKSVERVK